MNFVAVWMHLFVIILSKFPQIHSFPHKKITLHTYAQMWIHPFSHEYQLYPKDVQKLKSLALRATSRLKEIYGTTYRVGLMGKAFNSKLFF
jgi:hypothetical protein